jgi:hypothetical protein
MINASKQRASTTFVSLAVAVAVAMAIFALPAIGQYDLRFRAGDPFVFCTQGLKIPDPCWRPLPPYTGESYMLTGVCDPPNIEGRSWTVDDTESLAEYGRICPLAIESGAWKGQTPPESTPFEH